MTEPLGARRRIHPESSYIARLLANADAALAEPAPDYVLPPFPWLPCTIPSDANVRRSESGVTAQAENFCS